MSRLILNIPEIATVAAIEQEFYALFNANDYIEEITIDFKDVRFIEPSTSTAYLISMLYLCKEKGIRFRIKPPNDNGIKIILYSWRFFEVLEEITSVPIGEFAPGIKRDFENGVAVRLSSTVNRMLKYYQDVNKPEFQTFFRKKYFGQDSIYFLTAYENFFPLLSLNFNSKESKQEEFISEKNRWKNAELINRILSNNFSNIIIKDEISEDVVSETISNAIIHSTANKFFTGSYFPFFDKEPKRDDVFHFTINFWDNGESIIDTLGVPLKKNMPIKSEVSERYFQQVTQSNNQIEFLIKKEKGQYTEERFTTSSELHPDLKEEEILLAAFFPGVSRLPNRAPDLFNQFPAGIGLSYLTNTVINKLDGEIAVRTKNYFVNIKRLSNYDKDQYIKLFKTTDAVKPSRKDIFDDTATYYSAKFYVYNNKMPKFIGNMMTVRIPLKYKQNASV